VLYLRRSSIPALFLATVAQCGMTPGDLAEAVDIAFNGEVTQELEQGPTQLRRNTFPRIFPYAEKASIMEALRSCGSQRRRSESNRRMEVLQTSALPLGYGAGRTGKLFP
jgi:hypothetical protein